MTRRGSAAVLLSLAVLLLAVWVTSTDRQQLMGSDKASTHQLTLPITRQHAQKHGRAKAQLPGLQSSTPADIGLAGYIVLSTVAIVLIAFLLSVAVRSSRRQRSRRREESAQVDDAIEALGVPPALLETAERQLQAMREGTPRNAIVACWMELERSCSETGFPRGRAETSTEFTGRVLAHYAVDAGSVRALAALYREARFSEHQLTESERDRALAALEQILSNLRETRSTDQAAVASS